MPRSVCLRRCYVYRLCSQQRRRQFLLIFSRSLLLLLTAGVVVVQYTLMKSRKTRRVLVYIGRECIPGRLALFLCHDAAIAGDVCLKNQLQ